MPASVSLAGALSILRKRFLVMWARFEVSPKKLDCELRGIMEKITQSAGAAQWSRNWLSLKGIRLCEYLFFRVFSGQTSG